MPTLPFLLFTAPFSHKEYLIVFLFSPANGLFLSFSIGIFSETTLALIANEQESMLQ